MTKCEFMSKFSNYIFKSTNFCFIGATEVDPSAERLVAWLLENPNVPLSTSDTISSFDGLSDTDSISEEMDDGNTSYNERTTASPCFNQRSDFLSNDEYAFYVRDNIQVGMMVRCCKTYEEVHEGDVGRVLKIDREELHDLNVRVSIGRCTSQTRP